MKLILTLFIFGWIGFCYPAYAQSSRNPVDYVNVFTGTSNSRWMLGPYTAVPYGMVQLGPDNQEEGWMSGYDYSIMNVTGFSHIHAWTMAGLMVMPATQDFTKENGASSKAYRGAGSGFHSRIYKETEKASPGYYSCELYDADCKAELTASTHCGFHKYTFKAKEDVRILLILNFPTEYKIAIQSAEFNKVGNNIVEGFANTKAAFGEYKLYFTIQFNKPFKALNGWQNDTVKTNIEQITGKKEIGAFVTYSTTDNEAIMMKVGLSLVDMKGARNNLRTELDSFGWNFEAAVASAREKWNNLLSTIEVKGSEKNKEKFYTNFYRSFCKQTWSDVDGRYVDPLNRIQQLPKGGVMYGGDAFWNTFWNYNTILSLIAPGIMNNWVTTQLELFEKTGWTNNGPTGLKLTGIMEVTHEIALMVSAYQKGIRDYDVNLAFEGMKDLSEGLRAGKEIYKRIGYIPYETEDQSVSRTLEYAYDDWCVSRLAKDLNLEDFRRYSQKGNLYQNLFCNEVGFMRGKSGNYRWQQPFDPKSTANFTEGNAYQFSLFVPQDFQGLFKRMGGDRKAEQWLDRCFSTEMDANQTRTGDMTGNIGQYVHGNEPSHHMAYLYNYLGMPWKSQERVRQIMENLYTDQPDGLCGNEDAGQMSAWFVLSAMGFYSTTPGMDYYVIGSPLFKKVTLHLENGKQFIIKAPDADRNRPYVISTNIEKSEAPSLSTSA